ncbi:MAG: NYN domain-containing protein [Acidobacteriaceae bacterium]
MQRYAILVDAGYLLAQAAHIMSAGATKRRAGLDIHDPDGLVNAIKLEAAKHLDLTGKELLRIYWYDGVGPTGRTRQQKNINNIPDVQFRSGTINSRGQQKGVDTLLVIDLIELSTNQAISDAIIVASDGDFAAGIELAQRRGVRIAVLGIEDGTSGLRHNQSVEVLDRADRAGVATGVLVTPYCSYIPAAVPQSIGSPLTTARHAVAQPSAQPQQSSAINQAVAEFIAQNAPDASVIDGPTGRVDQATDRLLLYAVYLAVGRKLTPDEIRAARREFQAQMAVLVATSQQP